MSAGARRIRRASAIARSISRTWIHARWWAWTRRRLSGGDAKPSARSLQAIASARTRSRFAIRVANRGHPVPLAVAQRGARGGQRALDRGRIAAGPERLDPIDLAGLGGVLDLERGDVIALAGSRVLVDADDRPAPGVDLALELE